MLAHTLTRRSLLTGAFAVGAPGIRKYRDSRSAREVWEIGGGPAASHSCYFEAQAFTGDDRHLVYASNPSGAWQLYCVDLDSGRHRQLTHCGELSSLSYSVHTDGEHVIYLDGARLCRTRVPSGRTETLLDLALHAPKGARFSAGRTFSRDGVFTAAGYTAAGNSGLLLLNLAGRRVEKQLALSSGTGGHALICPSDPFLVTFVREPDLQNRMDLPMAERTRTMIADFRTGAVRPYLTMPYGWRATHEYWDHRGERFYFHKKHVPGWVPASICSMRRDGSDWQTHFTSETLMLGHSMLSADGRWIVSDVQKPGDNPLLLIEVATGRHTVLCWPDSSVTAGHSRQAHVHPSFSPHGRFITYTSDASGTPRAYVVPV